MVEKIEVTLEVGDLVYATITVLEPQLELVVPEATINLSHTTMQSRIRRIYSRILKSVGLL